MLSLPADLQQLFTDQLDGEWLHEGWPILGALGLWTAILLALTAGTMVRLNKGWLFRFSLWLSGCQEPEAAQKDGPPGSAPLPEGP